MAREPGGEEELPDNLPHSSAVPEGIKRFLEGIRALLRKKVQQGILSTSRSTNPILAQHGRTQWDTATLHELLLVFFPEHLHLDTSGQAGRTVQPSWAGIPCCTAVTLGLMFSGNVRAGGVEEKGS